MPTSAITRYSADELVQARKRAHRMRSLAKVGVNLVIELRRVDSPNNDLTLTFQGSPRDVPLAGVPSSSSPGASLFWRGKRIRGIDWNIKHEIRYRGVPTGAFIRGWHEHYWDEGNWHEGKDPDGHPPIRIPRVAPRKGCNMSGLIVWACEEWNIEDVPIATELFN